MYTSEEHGQFTHILDDMHQVMVVLVHASKRSTEHIVAALNEYDQPKDCDHCGIPVKREDVVTGAYGGTFCCDEHRQAYDKE